MKQSEIFENAADTYEEAVRNNKVFDPAAGIEFRKEDTSKDPCESVNGICDFSVVDGNFYENESYNFSTVISDDEVKDLDDLEWQVQLGDLRYNANSVNGKPEFLAFNRLPDLMYINTQLKEYSHKGKYKLFYKINLSSVKLDEFLSFQRAIRNYSENTRIGFTEKISPEYDVLDQRYYIYEIIFDWSNDR